MKRKIIVSVIVFSLFLGATSLYAATLTRLGTSPFYKAKDLKPQDVYRIVKANADIVKDGFIKARALDLYGPFMAQLESAKLEEIQVQPKETLLWMIFKKKNKAYLLRDVVWKGKKPFAAYRFVVNHGEQAHEFIFPKICMNIALRSITPVAKKPIAKKIVPPPAKKTAPPAAVPVVKKNEPPYCDIKAAPRRLFTGNIVTLDASDSHDPDGKIESVKLTLTNRSDNTVEEIVLSKAPFIYEANMKKAGDYEIRATVKDDRGDSESCVVDVKVLKKLPPPVVKKVAPPVVKKVAPPVAKKIVPPAAVAVVKKNEPPYCDLKAAPRQLFTDNIVTLDASGSYDPDGKIESVKLALTNRSDNTVEEIMLSKAPFIYEANMKKVGDYEIRATVKDDRGDSESCVVDVKVLKRGVFVADLGVLKQFDPATWLPIKVGYMYKIKENLVVTGLIGPAPLVSGNDDRPATIGDIILSYYMSNFFMGGGAGVFHTSNKTRADLILDTGYQITNNDNGPNISIYVQGRSAVDQFDNISKYGRLGIGLRMYF